MPEPSSLQTGHGHLVLTPQFAATAGKFQDPRLLHAIERAMSELKQQTGIMIPVHVQPASAASHPVFVIDVEGPGEKVQSVDENESYSLTVTSQGVHLRAATDVGAMHGLQTLLQLVQHTDTQYFLPAVTIHDSPRFPWRGLMLDCSRHFEPIPVIKRTLDAMAAVKMNVFHWHLSDDQGFRIQSKVFPLLTQRGSDGDFYTQAQAREIVAYARARGIRVVPEFDMPGHTSSWFAGYPNLASAPGPFHIERHFGVFDPVMDPTRASTYAFLDRFIGEMASIFPDPYMHIGGDENNGVEWKHNPRIQAFMRAHHLQGTAGLQAYFNRRLLKILQKYHKHMIGWDEVLAPGLPADVMIQSWRGYDSLAAAARKGYDGILSSGYYLDSMQTAAQHYEVDPVPSNSTLTPGQRKRILGGEACMWGEYVDANIIDSRVWPITAAIAERLWSPRGVNNVNDMYRRLRIESLRLESLGLTQISQEDASLRQLAGTRHIGQLKVLAATLQPATFDQRDQYTLQHNITQLTPLDHLVDALRPDPPFRHDFKQLVQNYLAHPDANGARSQRLRTILQAWVTQHPRVSVQMRHSPRLAPALVRSAQLEQMGSMGLQAIGYLSSGKIPPPGWRSAQLAILKQAAEPVDLTRFDVIEPMQQLVEAAAGKTAAEGKH
jgi:hexosaminidase